MMTFLVVTLSYMVVYGLHGHVRHILATNHFYVTCGGAPHQIQPHLASFQQKCLEIFFRRPGGCTCTPGYAYAPVTVSL